MKLSPFAEHLDRVRGKLQTTAQTTGKSSGMPIGYPQWHFVLMHLRPAWIAHGILDSFVDSFFPFVEEIGKEVTIIESVVYNEDSPGSIVTVPSHRWRRRRSGHVFR